MTKTVYLAGPITGLNYAGCTDWRHYAIDKLRPIAGISPMRGKEYLAGLAEISGHGREYANMGPLSLPRGVLTRDRWDCTRCDALLVNLLGAKAVSIGTMFEMAWADLSRIPIVLAMEETGGPHDHMFPRDVAGYIVPKLDDAIHIVRAMLLEPGQ